MFVKLTRMDLATHEVYSVWINLDQVVAIIPDYPHHPKLTQIVTSGDYPFLVKETPEEIVEKVNDNIPPAFHEFAGY